MRLRLSPLPGAARTGSDRQGPVQPVVIVIVLPLSQIRIEQMDVVRNPVAIEQVLAQVVPDVILLAENPPDLDLPKPESDDAMNAIKEQVEALVPSQRQRDHEVDFASP